MIIFLILIITILCTISGMGGGVIIKPLLDATTNYNVATISVLTAITVLAMAMVAIIRNVIKKTPIDYFKALALGGGAIIGGLLGQYIFNIFAEAKDDQLIKLYQNIILAIIIIIVFIYTTLKNPIRFNFKNNILYFLAGAIMGLISVFLGIGGGPINVVLLMLLFSMDIKKATVFSLIIIFFSQISKLFLITVTSGFTGLNLSLLPYMVIAAVIGGFCGSYINKRISGKAVTILFNIMQVVVIGIVIYNIINLLLMLYS